MRLGEAYELAYTYRDDYLKRCDRRGAKPNYNVMVKRMHEIVRENFQIKL